MHPNIVQLPVLSFLRISWWLSWSPSGRPRCRFESRAREDTSVDHFRDELWALRGGTDYRWLPTLISPTIYYLWFLVSILSFLPFRSHLSPLLYIYKVFFYPLMLLLEIFSAYPVLRSPSSQTPFLTCDWDIAPSHTDWSVRSKGRM